MTASLAPGCASRCGIFTSPPDAAPQPSCRGDARWERREARRSGGRSYRCCSWYRADDALQTEAPARRRIRRTPQEGCGDVLPGPAGEGQDRAGFPGLLRPQKRGGEANTASCGAAVRSGSWMWARRRSGTGMAASALALQNKVT